MKLAQQKYKRWAIELRPKIVFHNSASTPFAGSNNIAYHLYHIRSSISHRLPKYITTYKRKYITWGLLPRQSWVRFMHRLVRNLSPGAWLLLPLLLLYYYPLLLSLKVARVLDWTVDVLDVCLGNTYFNQRRSRIEGVEEMTNFQVYGCIHSTSSTNRLNLLVHILRPVFSFEEEKRDEELLQFALFERRSYTLTLPFKSLSILFLAPCFVIFSSLTLTLLSNTSIENFIRMMLWWKNASLPFAW